MIDFIKIPFLLLGINCPYLRIFLSLLLLLWLIKICFFFLFHNLHHFCRGDDEWFDRVVFDVAGYEIGVFF